MNINKILAFCKHFGIDPDNIAFYPGCEREIWMYIPELDFLRIYPQVPINATEYDDAVYDKKVEDFESIWWARCEGEYDEPAFNVYY